MADRFCPYCSCDYIPDTDDECPECGFRVPLEDPCPFCGSDMYPSDAGFCPTCGMMDSAYPERVTMADYYASLPVAERTATEEGTEKAPKKEENVKLLLVGAVIFFAYMLLG